jgi:hypothetical protein
MKSGLTRAGGQFVPVYRAVLSSPAWRGLSINARRFLDFLMLEWMAHAGKDNGELKAPHRQLEAFGIGARYIAAAIREAEEVGLVDCHRGGMRVATTYALTRLPLHDDTPASNRWATFERPVTGQPKIRNLPSEGMAGLPSEGKADGRNLPSEGKADGPKSLPSEGKALSRRRSNQGFLGGEQHQGPGPAAARALGPGPCSPGRDVAAEAPLRVAVAVR